MDTPDEFRQTRVASLLALFTSSSTLICCALPALLVAFGAGAALSSLVAAVPQLVWFSDHKAEVFFVATMMLVASGVLQLRSRYLPCPSNPDLAEACRHTRQRSLWIYLASAIVFLVGGFFAFIAPLVL